MGIMVIIVPIALVVVFSIVILQMRKKWQLMQYSRQDEHELQEDVQVNSYIVTGTPTLGNDNISAMKENHSKIENAAMETREREEDNSQTTDVEMMAVDGDHRQTTDVEIMAVDGDNSQTTDVEIMAVDGDRNQMTDVEIMAVDGDNRQTETADVEIIDAEEDHSSAEIQAVENNQSQEESGNGNEADEMFSTPHFESSLHIRPVLLVPRALNPATSQTLALPPSATLPPMQIAVPPPQHKEGTTISPLPDEGIVAPPPPPDEGIVPPPPPPDEGIVPPPPQPEMGSAPSSKSTTTLSLSKQKSRPTDDLEIPLLDSEPSSSLRTESAVNNDADTIDNVNSNLVENRQK